MRPVPIPDGVAERLGGERVVIGVEDLASGLDVNPCEYLVRPSALYPGRPAFTVMVDLDPAERDRLAAGAVLLLTLDGAEVPWTLQVTERVPE